jgi:hypothetical protein
MPRLRIYVDPKDKNAPKIRKQFKKPVPDQLAILQSQLRGDRYEQLCRGEYVPVKIFYLYKNFFLVMYTIFICTFKPMKPPTKPLTCRYLSDHPALKIAPLKEELMHDYPHVWFYHDVLTKKQTSVFQNLSTPKVNRQIKNLIYLHLYKYSM